MKKQREAILLLSIVTVFIISGLFLPGLIGAGDLDPSSPPGSTMHTLEDIYTIVLDTNTKVTPAPCTGSASVEKTGQTGCWDTSGNPISCAGTGQDGDLQVGVASPSPRFTDNGDGTVTDNLTELIWLKNANCFEQRTWATALSDSNGLASGSCGLSDGSVAGDWRLPNVKELQSLIDYGSYNPSLPSGYLFTSVQSSRYWSGTSDASTTTRAWQVHMYDANVYYRVKTESDYVWPVRGGN